LFEKGAIIMKSTGMIRKVDDLGRVVLPAEMRRMLEINEQDELELYVEGDKLILQKFLPRCIFCGDDRRLVSYYGKNLCMNCIATLRKC
jgi:transcriptional pleiotropic regulator of transition state genes